jgi:hypothetical protein
VLATLRLISVGISSQFCVPRLKIALDLWTVHETGNGKKVTRLLAVDVDTKNKERHCCYNEYLWCVLACVHMFVWAPARAYVYSFHESCKLCRTKIAKNIFVILQ